MPPAPDVRETMFTVPEFVSLDNLKRSFTEYTERKAARAERGSGRRRAAAAVAAAAEDTAGTEAVAKPTFADDSEAPKRGTILGKRERHNPPHKAAKKGKQDAAQGGKSNTSYSTLESHTLRLGTARPVPQARGHTAFLSFATL